MLVRSDSTPDLAFGRRFCPRGEAGTCRAPLVEMTSDGQTSSDDS